MSDRAIHNVLRRIETAAERMAAKEDPTPYDQGRRRDAFEAAARMVREALDAPDFRGEERLDRMTFLSRIESTYGKLVPPEGPYVLLADIYAAFGAGEAYAAIRDAATRSPTAQAVRDIRRMEKINPPYPGLVMNDPDAGL